MAPVTANRREPFVYFFALAVLCTGTTLVGRTLSSPAEAQAARAALRGPGIADVIYTGFYLLFATIDVVTDGEASESTRNAQPVVHTDAEYAEWLAEWERSPDVSPAMRELARESCDQRGPRARHDCIGAALDDELARRVEAQRWWDTALVASVVPWIAALVLFVRFRLWKRRRVAGG